MKKTIALLVVLLLGVSLFAQNVRTGKYTMTAMLIEDVDILNTFKEMGLDTEGCYIELLSGSIFRMVMFGDENEAQGSFKVSGDNIIFYSEDEELNGKIQGSRITIEDEDCRMIYERK